MSSQLLNTDEAAEYLNTSARHIRELRYRRDIAAVKLGRSVRYRIKDLDDFIEANREPARQAS